MGIQRGLLPRQQISLERRPPRIVTAMGIPSAHRRRPRISLETRQRRIGTIMAILLVQRERTKTSLAIQTPPTRIPMDARLELRLLQPMYLERQPPRIVITTARPSAPRLRQRIILELKTRSNEVTPVTHPSGHGDLSLH